MVQDVQDRLIARLAELSRRYDELNEQLADPAVAANPGRSVGMTKEVGRLRRIVDPFRSYCKVRKELEDARHLAADRSQEADLRELAAAELDTLQARHDERSRSSTRAEPRWAGSRRSS